MYEKYLQQIEEAGKIRNLISTTITCYKNYVTAFLKHMNKSPEELTCQDVRQFLLEKKDAGLKATTLKLYNSSIRFFYRNVLHILWDDIMVPRMMLDHKLPTVLSLDEINRLLDACYATEWIPYCKKTFHGAQSVIDYLGKYTHRIAISNHRIIRMDEKTVTFSVKDYINKGQWKELTLSGIEFIRRFLMHVPPRRFVRIRHYGLLCSRTKNKKLTLCRNLLGCQKYLSKLREMEMPEMLEHLYGIKVCVCKVCGGHLGKPQKRLPLRC